MKSTSSLKTPPSQTLNSFIYLTIMKVHMPLGSGQTFETSCFVLSPVIINYHFSFHDNQNSLSLFVWKCPLCDDRLCCLNYGLQVFSLLLKTPSCPSIYREEIFAEEEFS
eukprot:TRINITY_DN3077_c1_g1_i1.p1 TRINITY_DN3077_c1_g1~~TRINITY_DN3077_c1_g1_i1.p1  ORF type:complete len:110 (+),score=9.87 TRINITY_DN3077_c1_g1_i1:723-1052(+)